MPKLYDQSDDRLLGEVSQQDVDLLIAQMEEESSLDRDYFIDNETFLRLVDAGASSALLDAIKSALDIHGECDVRWEAD
jgi:hypothetical protein